MNEMKQDEQFQTYERQWGVKLFTGAKDGSELQQQITNFLIEMRTKPMGRLFRPHSTAIAFKWTASMVYEHYVPVEEKNEGQS